MYVCMYVYALIYMHVYKCVCIHIKCIRQGNFFKRGLQRDQKIFNRPKSFILGSEAPSHSCFEGQGGGAAATEALQHGGPGAPLGAV